MNKALDDSAWRYHVYVATNEYNQYRVSTEFTFAIKVYWDCVLGKMLAEDLKIRRELLKLSPDDPRYKHIGYVSDRLVERQDRIRKRSDSFADKLQNRRDVTLDQLKKELAAATREWNKY
jgi:hypothetical protein